MTDLFHTVLSIKIPVEECDQKTQIFHSLSVISSLFLIDNLNDYIQFINSTKSPDSVSLLISRVFTVYTEMRNISHAFDTILSHNTIPHLSSLYNTNEIRSCLEQQVLGILPLQLLDILNRLLPYLLDTKYHCFVVVIVVMRRL